MNRDGRVLIPKQVRQELGLDAGATLVLSVEDGRVILESRDQLMARIRREVADAWQGTPGESAAEALLADRRAEDHPIAPSWRGRVRPDSGRVRPLS